MVLYRLLLAKNVGNVFERMLKNLRTGQNYYRSHGLTALTQALSDEYCPHCDNHFVLEAITPTPALQVEGEDARKDARMLKDDRIRSEPQGTIFGAQDAADRLG